jgi:hypothetical protein
MTRNRKEPFGSRPAQLVVRGESNALVKVAPTDGQRGSRDFLDRSLFLGCIIALVTLALGCTGGRPASLTELDDSRRLAADLRIQFNKAADASDRAVMADTDEASIAFARDAEKAAQAVETDVAALAPLLHNLAFPNEIRVLEGFRKHLVEYRNLDRNILTLAVENTNLKAQRLSFGPAQQAADAFRDSLGSLASTIATKDRCRVEALVAKATLAVREIQILQAPHIAESDDAVMTRIEGEMAKLDSGARDTLKDLAELAPTSAASVLATAQSALDRFKAVSSEIVSLSRRNTNVRSLELSLRTKPALVAACDDSLHTLQEALANEGSKATR